MVLHTALMYFLYFYTVISQIINDITIAHVKQGWINATGQLPSLALYWSFPVGRPEFQGTARGHSSSILLPGTVSILRARQELAALERTEKKQHSQIRRIITCSPVGTCYPDLKSSAILPKSWKAFAHYLRGCSTVRKKCHLGNLLAGCSPGLFWTIFHLPLPDLLSFNFKNRLSTEGSLLFGPPFLCSSLWMPH